jgi:predicted nucleic acid-binding protein
MARATEYISFDTPGLIWGIRGEATAGQEHQIETTKRYIKIIKKQKGQIMITTPALSEYLIGANETEQKELEILQRGFLIANLDVNSARLAAELQRDRIRELKEESQISKVCIKVDALIVAISITNHASKIFTHDKKHFQSLAKGRIPIIGPEDIPPEPPTSGRLWIEDPT